MTTRRVGVEGVHTYYRIDFLLHQHYLRRLNNNNVDRRENAPALARVGGTELVPSCATWRWPLAALSFRRTAVPRYAYGSSVLVLKSICRKSICLIKPYSDFLPCFLPAARASAYTNSPFPRSHLRWQLPIQRARGV